MTPGARVQAAIEIMDQVIAAAHSNGAAADTLAARWFKDRRFAGAKDRRAIRELLYAAIRRAGGVPASGRAALLGLAEDRPELLALFDGAGHAPGPVQPDEAGAPTGIAPAWLTEKLAATLASDELPGLLARAPLDIRVNRLKSSLADIQALFPEAQPGAHAADALRLAEGTPVEALPAFAEGWFEVQDEGSQLLAEACAVRPGDLVVDLCAGAGGKTLALAAALQNQGRLIACDVDRARLSRLAPRAERAGAVVQTRLLDGGREAAALGDLHGLADVVLVDAPCSGSGTWRRNPEARWRLTPDRLARTVALQAHVLAIGAALVRPGGRFVYAVCSLLDEEGREQVDAFLRAHPGWSVTAPGFAAGRTHGPGRRLTPAHDGTDGFFVACLTAPC